MLRVAEQAHRTDVGRQRQHNEDNLFAEAPLFAVADGMGGAQAGEVASEVAVSELDPRLDDHVPVEQQLRELLQIANERIYALAGEDESRAGMGTTVTAAWLGEHEVSLAHVGDSRAYLFRDGSLRRLTRDHSLVGELVRRGELTEEQAEVHPQRSIITRALGPEADVEVDTQSVAARDGDVYLLCSDGLTTMLPDDRIAERLARGDSLRDTVDELVSAANAAGGRDNITVVAFRVEELDVDGDRGDAHTTTGKTGELDTGAIRAAAGAAAVGSSADGPATRTSAAGAERAGRREETAEASRTAGGRSAVADGPPRTTATAAPAARDRDATAARRRRPRTGTLVKIAVALALLAVLVGGAIYGLRHVYFLGTDDAGRVSLYRGLPYELPAGIELYSLRYSSPLQTSELSTTRRDVVRAHELRSESNAVDLISDIERAQGLRRGTERGDGGGGG